MSLFLTKKLDANSKNVHSQPKRIAEMKMSLTSFSFLYTLAETVLISPVFDINLDGKEIVYPIK